jgi:hypothetical protein
MAQSDDDDDKSSVRRAAVALIVCASTISVGLASFATRPHLHQEVWLAVAGVLAGAATIVAEKKEPQSTITVLQSGARTAIPAIGDESLSRSLGTSVVSTLTSRPQFGHGCTVLTPADIAC